MDILSSPTFTENKQLILLATATLLTAILISLLTSKPLPRTSQSCPITSSSPVPSKFKRLTEKGSPEIILATLAQKSAYPHSSPFVAKLDAVLRTANLKFTVKTIEYTQLPTEKIPVVHWNGEILSDSHLIIKRLVKEGVMQDLDAWLTDEQKARANMFRYGIENFIYFRMVQERWIHNWELTKKEYFEGTMPWLVYKIVPDRFIQPNVVDMLYKNGTTRYPEESWLEMLVEFWRDAAELLGDKKYFFGNESKCVVDLSAFGVLTNVIEFRDLNPTLYDVVVKHENLVRFTERVKKELYQ
ncbi:UNVERIFIED_CONTAM: hypothetical protein HDU68_003406 [Siphonaria sp. JEL0065]|nr:hypothetical protein HDU68_003406 [Siphonaria sp. JEL0065]